MTYGDYHQEIVTILDFGSQYTQLIARRVRELGVYCEIVPFNTSIEKIRSAKPVGDNTSGGPRSVTEEDAPICDEAVFRLGAPMLGICYGIQLIAKMYGGEVQRSEKREYGRAHIYMDGSRPLLEGIEDGDTIWMSHGDAIMRMPPGYTALAHSENSPYAAIGNESRAGLRRPVPPRGAPYPEGQGHTEEFSLHDLQGEGAILRRLVHRDDHPEDKGASRRREGGLRAFGRRRLIGRSHPPPQGDRRQAHLRIRKQRRAQEERRAGGARSYSRTACT